MREKKKHEFLTEVELEFMSKLWALGGSHRARCAGQTAE